MLVALVIFCCGNDATKVEIRSATKDLGLLSGPHLLGQRPRPFPRFMSPIACGRASCLGRRFRPRSQVMRAMPLVRTIPVSEGALFKQRKTCLRVADKIRPAPRLDCGSKSGREPFHHHSRYWRATRIGAPSIFQADPPGEQTVGFIPIPNQNLERPYLSLVFRSVPTEETPFVLFHHQTGE
jgi:hypothetical protein